MSTPSPAGIFIWYELMTTDTAAALKFYGDVLGWTATPMPAGGMPYTLVSAGGHNAGGVMELPADVRAMGTPPCWTGYIGVADIDAKVAQLQAAGGKVLRAPSDIPTVGRFAVVSDPHGAVFIMMTPVSKEPMPAIAPDALGHVGWRELHAGDGVEAFAFYSALFGWTKDMTVDMGNLGVYQTFATGGPMVGGMMTKMPDTPQPFWTYYFNVDGIDAAIERVAKAGGKLLMGPHPVPGDSWIAQCIDPQGAFFSLTSKKR